MTIFALDDDKTILRLYKGLFADQDIHLFFCSIKLYEALEDIIPDIMIVDLVMPHDTGWHVVDTLRLKGYTFPIIIATALEGEEQKVLAATLGCGFWHKSANAIELRELVYARL